MKLIVAITVAIAAGSAHASTFKHAVEFESKSIYGGSAVLATSPSGEQKIVTPSACKLSFRNMENAESQRVALLTIEFPNDFGIAMPHSIRLDQISDQLIPLVEKVKNFEFTTEAGNETKVTFHNDEGTNFGHLNIYSSLRSEDPKAGPQEQFYIDYLLANVVLSASFDQVSWLSATFSRQYTDSQGTPIGKIQTLAVAACDIDFIKSNPN